MADIGNNQAAFTEVLEIKVDTAQFEAGLKEVEALYEDFVSRVGEEKASTIFGIGGTQAIVDELNGLREHFDEFDRDITTGWEQSMRTMTEAQEAWAGNTELILQRIVDQEAANAERIIALQEEVAAAKQKSSGSGGAGFGGDIFGQMASLTRVYILWQLISFTIQKVVDLVKLPFDIIEEGNQYLAETAKQADELTGVLHANVQYSSDLSENFRLASIAAEGVVSKLRMIAASDNLKFDNLSNAFKSLTEEGGARFVKTTEDMVRLTELLNLALKASGVSAQTTRRLISEIPQLLNGTLPPTSKWLEVLHLNADEWKTIRDRAKEHQDLLEQLAPKMQPYIDAVQQGARHQEQLKSQIDEIKKKWEGALAQPFTDKYDEALRKLLDWMKNHEGDIKSFAEKWQTFWSTMLGGGVGVGANGEDMSGAGLGVPQENEAQAARTFGPTRADMVPPPSPSDVLGRGIKDKNNHPQLGKGKGSDILREYTEELRAHITEIKGQTQNAVADIDNLVAASALSVEAAEQRKDAAYEKEAARIRAAVRLYKDLADASGADPKKVSAFDAKASNIQQTNFNEIDAKENAARKASTEDLFQKEQQHRRDELKEYQELRNKEIELAKLRGLTEEQTAKMIQATNEGVFSREQELLKESIAHYAEGTKVRLALEDQLATAQKAHLYQQQIDQQKVNQAMVIDAQRRISEEMAADMAHLHQQEAAVQAQEKTNVSASKLRQSNHLLALEYLRIVDSAIQATRAALLNAQANGVEESATRKLREELNKLNVERDKAARAARNTAGHAPIGPVTQHDRNVSNAQQDASEKLQALVNAQLAAFIARLSGNADAIAKADKEVKQFEADLKQANQALEDAKGSWGDVGNGIVDKIFGDGSLEKLKGDWGDAGAMVKDAADMAGNALKNLPGIIGAIQQGYKQGGVLGGIAAGMNQFMPALEQIPVVGQFMPVISGVLGFIGGLFTRAAKKIAEQVKKQLTATVNDYNAGNSTLIQTLNSLEKQRQDAINRLSGKKGGKDQLNQLLPQFDQEIASLKKQQKETLDNFNDSLAVLQAGSDELGNWVKTWQDINKQVKEYLDAGGDAAKAQQFLALNLKKQQQDLQNQLNDGEQTAIQDALQLNDLLKQRNDLQTQYVNDIFQLETADSMERRGVGSIDRAFQIAQKKKEYQDQLDSLNQQIDLTTKKVDMEKSVFNISSDIAALHRRDEQLTLIALEDQLNKYKDMLTLLNQGGYGAPSALIAQGLRQLGSAGQTTNVITVNAYGSGASPQAIADTISYELSRQARQSP